MSDTTGVDDLSENEAQIRAESEAEERANAIERSRDVRALEDSGYDDLVMSDKDRQDFWIRAGREQMAAEIVRLLEAVPDEVYPADVFGGPLSTDDSREMNELLKDQRLPTLDRVGANVMRHAYRAAARLVREHAEETRP